LQRLKTSNTQRPTPNVELGKALAAESGIVAEKRMNYRTEGNRGRL
jgi:hypothetical protein